MATKSQLKQYFETGKIPTQVQFGELIDFIQPLITDNVTDRPNQTLLFGGDTPNPIINGLRIIHYYQNDDNIHNYWIFTNEAGVNNRYGISVPMFVIKRVSSEEPNISLDMLILEYAIPTREQLTSWVKQGYDCDTADAYTLHSALTKYLTFKPWSEGGGSLTVNSVISEPGQYNIVTFGYNSTSLFTAFELTLTRNTNGHFIVGLLKQTEYILANGQFRPKITWFSLAAKTLGNMPYYTGSKTFGDIVSFAKANLNSNTSEPNLQH